MPPSAGKAQLFADRDYGGSVTTVDEGIHDLGPGAAGNGNDAVSSLKIVPGYEVIVYSGRQGQGTSATFTADTADVGEVFSGVIASVQVSAAQAPGTAPDWYDQGKPPDWFEATDRKL
jgi:hypothetical protein